MSSVISILLFVISIGCLCLISPISGLNINNQKTKTTSSTETEIKTPLNNNNNNPPKTTHRITVDYAIIGGGTSGSIIASRINEKNPQRDQPVEVALIEAGLNQTDNPLVFDPSKVFQQRHTQLQWNSFSNPRKTSIHQGRSLGGSSNANAAAYQRGMAQDWNRIAEKTDSDIWRFKSVLQYYKKAESSSIDDPIYHGHGGPMNIVNRAFGYFTSIWRQTAKEMGYAWSNDMNGAIQEAFGFEQFTLQENGRRESTATGYLNSENTHRFHHTSQKQFSNKSNRSNLHIFTNTQVLKILFDDINKKPFNPSNSNNRIRARSVLCIGPQSQVWEIRSRHGIILSAGAIRSPFLLMQSGIGPQLELEQAGIGPVLHLEGLGSNLMDNMGLFMKYHSRYLTANRSCDGHPAALVPSHPNTKERPPVYIINKLNPKSHSFDLLLVDTKHQGRGRVGLYNNNPLSMPRVDLDLFHGGNDTQALKSFLEGIRMVRRVMKTTTMKRNYAPVETEPGATIESDAAILEFLKKQYSSGTMIHMNHYSGSCRMGPVNDPRTVVDSRSLRVMGTRNLFVMDSSVIPEMPCCGTYAPTIAVGEIGADMIEKEINKMF
eukprot:gb/GECH01014378.1/.p1 GENE.gb/GECH01014378.1/~~gb/GECH01014378.1/.p1  ORF type:complete len:604 (+),score=135.31 gb/GECH01014378.1/:1-1812(+)